jgi:hypothetical protein
MRSAQRKNRIENSRKRGRIFSLLIKVFIPLILVLSVFLYLKLSTRYWNGHDKFAFVFENSSGQVEVTVLDPALGEETTLIIPGDTEINVARGYGTLRIKNVWQLGVNEKLGGGLLAETLTDSFLFPTNLWSGTDLSNVWKFIFSPKATNISFGDRLAAGIFALRVSGINKTEIDLAKSQFLMKKTLMDGKPGFVLMGPVSSRLTVYFSDNNFAAKNLRFSITDATGSFNVAGGVGQVLEVLGGKVVVVDKKPIDNSLDCEVFGRDSSAVKKVASLFSCKKISGKSNFDLEMRIGSKFAKRF